MSYLHHQNIQLLGNVQHNVMEIRGSVFTGLWENYCICKKKFVKPFEAPEEAERKQIKAPAGSGSCKFKKNIYMHQVVQR